MDSAQGSAIFDLDLHRLPKNSCAKILRQALHTFCIYSYNRNCTKIHLDRKFLDFLRLFTKAVVWNFPLTTNFHEAWLKYLIKKFPKRQKFHSTISKKFVHATILDFPCRKGQSLQFPASLAVSEVHESVQYHGQKVEYSHRQFVFLMGDTKLLIVGPLLYVMMKPKLFRCYKILVFMT
jgi:hypothetical protein